MTREYKHEVGDTHLCWEHVEELQELEADRVLQGHGGCADDTVQGTVGHTQQGHQPHLYVTICLHKLLELQVQVYTVITTMTHC